jgi:hypothetical protein
MWRSHKHSECDFRDKREYSRRIYSSGMGSWGMRITDGKGITVWGVLRFTLNNPINFPERKFALKIQKKHLAIGCDSRWNSCFDDIAVFNDGDSYTSHCDSSYINDTGLDNYTFWRIQDISKSMKSRFQNHRSNNTSKINNNRITTHITQDQFSDMIFMKSLREIQNRFETWMSQSENVISLIFCIQMTTDRFLFIDRDDDFHRQRLFQIRNDEIQALLNEWMIVKIFDCFMAFSNWHFAIYLEYLIEWSISQFQGHSTRSRKCGNQPKLWQNDRMKEPVFKSLRNFHSNPITARILHPNIHTVCNESVE